MEASGFAQKLLAQKNNFSDEFNKLKSLFKDSEVELLQSSKFSLPLLAKLNGFENYFKFRVILFIMSQKNPKKPAFLIQLPRFSFFLKNLFSFYIPQKILKNSKKNRTMETKNNQAIRDSISETLNNLSVGGVKAFSEKFLPVDNSFLQSTYQQSNYRQFFELSFGLVQIYKNPTHFLAKMHNNLKKVYEKQELLALAPNSIAKTTQVLKEAKVEFDFVNNTLQSAILLIVQRDFSPFTRSQILKILSTDDAKPSTIVKGNNVDGPKNALEEIYEILSSQLPGGIMEYWENEAKNGRISQEILKKIGTEMESCKKSIEERKNKEKMEYVHPKTENSSFIYSSYSPFSSSSSSSVEIVPYKEKIKVRDPSKTVFVGLKNQGAFVFSYFYILFDHFYKIFEKTGHVI